MSPGAPTRTSTSTWQQPSTSAGGCWDRELGDHRGHYRRLSGRLQGFGPVTLVGIEGTGSYGAGLTRHLSQEQIAVVEVDRPNRQRRRRKGKSDPEGAISPAHAAHSGDAKGPAKTRDGDVVGSSADGKGEEGIDRSLERAGTPMYLGEEKPSLERGEHGGGEVVRVDVGRDLPVVMQ